MGKGFKFTRLAAASAMAGVAAGFFAGYSVRPERITYVQQPHVEFYSRLCDSRYDYMVYSGRRSDFEFPLSREDAVKKFAEESNGRFAVPVFYCDPDRGGKRPPKT